MIPVQNLEAKILGKAIAIRLWIFGEEIAKFLLGRKGGGNNQN
jgi:hypothetical protein